MLEKIDRKRVAGWSPQQLSSTLLGRCASPPPKPWAGRGLQTKRIVWCREGSMVLVRFRDGANKIQRKQIVRYHLFPFSQLLFPSPAQPLLPSLLPPLACRSHETDMFCDLTTVTATRKMPRRHSNMWRSRLPSRSRHRRPNRNISPRSIRPRPPRSIKPRPPRSIRWLLKSSNMSPPPPRQSSMPPLSNTSRAPPWAAMR